MFLNSFLSRLLSHDLPRNRWLALLLVAGWYHAISYLANGARVEREDWAATFPR